MSKNDMNKGKMPLPNQKIYDLAMQTTGSVNSFAELLEVRQQSLDRLFKEDRRNGKYPSISSSIKKALKEKMGVEEIYLLTDSDTIQSASGECGMRNDGKNDIPSISYATGRPFYDVDFLGGFDLVINDQTIRPDYNIDFKPYNKDGVVWCNITGHSMEPLISNGDIIAIKEMREWRDFILYGEVYGVVTEDMRTVKVVTKSDRGDDYLKLIPINKSEEYHPQDIPTKMITHIFKVIGCMKKMW